MESPSEHIDKQLKDLPVEGGFKVPEGYFDDLKVLVYYQTVYPSESEHQSTVSEDYFNQAKHQILNQTVAREPAKVFKLRSLAKYVSIAASVVLVAGAVFLVLAPKTEQIQNVQLSDEEIIGFLEEDPMREVAVDEVAGIVPVNEVTVETNEEEYLILETL